MIVIILRIFLHIGSYLVCDLAMDQKRYTLSSLNTLICIGPYTLYNSELKRGRFSGIITVRLTVDFQAHLAGEHTCSYIRVNNFT